ncbi:MAG: ABC transporter ATP-binding protein [Propionibacteriaceae bacterium]|jgi:putative ABC transport system ATP-binding protein|nr:ABC transporter ATP-binding protein [Propionibacteriaceae bacterium]
MLTCVEPSTNTGQSIRAIALAKTYGQGDAAVAALRGVDVEFPAGRFSAIMGPSGSGKSTLMHLLAGLDQPKAGQVFLGDRELTGLSDNDLTRLRRDRIGFVFQSYNLLPMFTARQNIMLPLRLAGRAPDLDLFDRLVSDLGLAQRLEHRPSQLSGGQQQRVAIARALITRPAVVFADEPTGNLDRRSSVEVLALLRLAVDQLGQTVVMVTHDPTAATWADQVVLLADGQIAGRLDQPDPTTVLAALDRLGRN